MVRQQSQRRGCRSSQATSAIQHGDGDEHITNEFDEHKQALEFLAGAVDLSMVESSALARPGKLEFLGHMMLKSQRFHWLLDAAHILQLYTHAAVNSMDVILHSIKGCLLDPQHSKATSIVGGLCNSISRCITYRVDDDRAQQELHLQLAASGLVPALIKFTLATWQEVQQLDTSDQQQQPQQLQQLQEQSQSHQRLDCRARQMTASFLVTELLGLWNQILLHTLAFPRPDVSFHIELPALIGLTAALYSIIKNAKTLMNNRTSSFIIPVDVCDAALSNVAAFGLTIAEYIVSSDWSKPKHLEIIYLTEKLPELLLQLLAFQVGQLHTLCDGVSQALQAHHSATAKQIQQLDQQQQQNFAGCVVPKSHLVYLQSVGMVGLDESAGVATKNIEFLVQRYAMTLDTVCGVVLARCRSAAQSDSSSSNSSSCNTTDANQQQLENKYSVLPSHLSVPAVKLLIEAVLLAPADKGLDVHAGSLNVVRLLLHTAATTVPAATVAAVGCEQGHESFAVCPWPQLPAAVVAGVLRPVVAQLPQAVMYCLLQTDQQQQQQLKTERLMLLHSYGSLLNAVCQSVESKHIAVVLKSQPAPDLLVTLAAVEAVIRAQACHLAPQHWKEEQQQQQHQAELHESTFGSSSSTTNSCPVPDILQYSQEQAPVLLLPFALKIAEAVLELMQLPRQQQHWLAPSDSTGCSALLSVRLFTLLSTVLTLCQAATIAACSACIGTTASTQPAANIEQRPTIEDVLSYVSIVSHAVSTAAYSWWHALDEGMPSEGSAVMPAVLLLRAVSIWSASLCQLLQTSHYQYQSGSAVVNAVRGSCLLARLLGPATLVTDVLAAAAAAAACLDEAAAAAAAAAAHAAPPDPVISHRLTPSCNGSSLDAPVVLQCLASRSLAGLLHKGRALKSAVQSALNSGVDCMEADTYLSLKAQPQDSGPISKLQYFADTLHRLCESALAALSLRYCCSNAQCSNLTKLSEWQLVCGKACVCSGCGLARYCSISCQKQHRSLHKHVCGRHT